MFKYNLSIIHFKASLNKISVDENLNELKIEYPKTTWPGIP